MKKEVKKMCKQAVVLDTIKKMRGKGGMTASQIQLAEAQAEDYAEMKKEIQEMKSDVGDLKKGVTDMRSELSTMKGSLDILIQLSEHKPLLQIVKELKDCKGFWIILALIIIGYFGLDLSNLKGLFQ
jgi:hypothetical protein